MFLGLRKRCPVINKIIFDKMTNKSQKIRALFAELVNIN